MVLDDVGFPGAFPDEALDPVAVEVDAFGDVAHALPRATREEGFKVVAGDPVRVAGSGPSRPVASVGQVRMVLLDEELPFDVRA
jgi:hypothetical protein